MLSLEGAVTCAVVRKPIACVLHLSLVKFQQDGLKGCTVTVAWYKFCYVSIAPLPCLSSCFYIWNGEGPNGQKGERLVTNDCVHSGAVWRIRKKMPQTRCQKLPQRPLRKKRGLPNSVWRQLIISQTMHCHGSSAMWPPCCLPWILPVHSGRHVGQVRRSCTKLVFAGNQCCVLYLYRNALAK